MTGNVPHTVRESPEQAADILGIRSAPGSSPSGSGPGGGAAAAAMPGVALHPGDHRRDRRQIDLVEAGRQLWSASSSAAWHCAQREGRAVTVSSGASASRRPPPLRPRLPWRGPSGQACPAVRLLALRGRQAGVVGRLRRQAAPGFQLRRPRRQRLHLCPQRVDERIFLGVRERRQVREPVHPELESRTPWSRQALRRCLPTSPDQHRG
jgi:hypothetical protein